MKKLMKQSLLTTTNLSLLYLSFAAQATLALEHKEDVPAVVHEHLRQILPAYSIKSSPVKGMFTVLSSEGIYQVSEDGKFLLVGEVFNIEQGKVNNITNYAIVSVLEETAKTAITFKAEHERYVVTVFFDTTCHYCSMMFRRTQEYNALGITLRYLAFPRAGLASAIAAEMEGIWQSENPHQALIDKELSSLSPSPKEPSLIRKHYALASMFQIKGTPTIVLSNGRTIGGYAEPQRLLHLLEQNDAQP